MGEPAEDHQASAEMGAEANRLWDAGDIDGWLGLFRDDASFRIPGEGALAGSHNKAKARDAVHRLMSAGGRYVIEQFSSPNGIATLFEQPVSDEKVRYHGMDVYEYRPDDRSQFAMWSYFPHEYPRFAEAWAR